MVSAMRQGACCAGLALLGHIEEKFVDVMDVYEPLESGQRDKCFISKGCAPCSHSSDSCWTKLVAAVICAWKAKPWLFGEQLLLGFRTRLMCNSSKPQCGEFSSCSLQMACRCLSCFPAQYMQDLVLLMGLSWFLCMCRYDATSHFETTAEDVLEMYTRITGKVLDLSLKDPSQAAQ